MLKKADRVYIFPRYGNPYDNYIGVPVKYSKKEALKLAEIEVRKMNFEDKGRFIKFRNKKVRKVKDTFFNLLSDSKRKGNPRFETKYEKEYLCWAVPIEIIESRTEYEMLVENRLKDVLRKEKNKKIHGIRKKLVEKRKMEDVRKAIALLMEKHEEEKTGKKISVDPNELIIME